MKIEDSSAYFWDNVDRIVSEDFVPNDKDILLVRYRTTGVIEQKFEMKRNMFHVFDVGGQKSERKKWIHCFEMVTAVIFVAALSCYDEVMFEDETKNSMSDSIELFGVITNNEYFKETAMILFLNKKDLYAEKIRDDKPITLCPDFEGYDGPAEDYDKTTAYIKRAFESKDDDSQKQIFTHLTCAVDKNQVEKVFNDIQTVIINASLAQGGLIA
jgi:guanine nucleotide-binding protein G(o) subunit alpha